MSARRSAENGAVGTLVALLFGGFVMTGLLAWSIDAGQIFFERRQTQNAADAAAFALAQSCAKSNCNLNADTLPALVAANTVNVGSRTHTIERQCKIRWTLGTLPLCTSSPSISNLRECPPLPSSVNPLLPYVEVRVRADDNGAPSIPNPFTRANDTGPDTTNVTSCARAAWGIPGSGSFTAPITISTCEWNMFSAGGTIYYPAPSGAWPGYGGAGQSPWPQPPTTPNTPGHEIVIMLHDPAAGQCPSGPSGGDAPGGFGYLDTTGSCSVSATTTNNVDYWAGINTGSAAPNSCRDMLAGLRDNGPVIDLPIFDCIVNNGSGPKPPDSQCNSGNGANAKYHLAGVARFYLSGFRITGSDTRPSRVTGTVPCTGSQRCISGWFVSGVLSSPASVLVPPTPAHPGFGLYAVIGAG